jgi:hypothetical protein
MSTVTSRKSVFYKVHVSQYSRQLHSVSKYATITSRASVCFSPITWVSILRIPHDSGYSHTAWVSTPHSHTALVSMLQSHRVLQYALVQSCGSVFYEVHTSRYATQSHSVSHSHIAGFSMIQSKHVSQYSTKSTWATMLQSYSVSQYSTKSTWATMLQSHSVSQYATITSRTSVCFSPIMWVSILRSPHKSVRYSPTTRVNMLVTSRTAVCYMATSPESAAGMVQRTVHHCLKLLNLTEGYPNDRSAMQHATTYSYF